MLAEYPLYHVTYASGKFGVAASNGLGGDAFTRNYIIDLGPLGQGHMKCSPVPCTSCDL